MPGVKHLDTIPDLSRIMGTHRGIDIRTSPKGGWGWSIPVPSNQDWREYVRTVYARIRADNEPVALLYAHSIAEAYEMADALADHLGLGG